MVCKTVSADQVCKDSRIAAQGVQPLVRNAVTQSAPEIQVSELFAPQDAHTGNTRIEVRPYLFDKPGFNVLTFLSLTRKTLEKDLLAVKHSGRLNERSLCLSKELFPVSESPV